MSLSKKRQRFSKMQALLEHYILFLGIDYAIDFVKRCDDCPVGHPNSVHKHGLAVDIHLYGPGNTYPHPDAHHLYSTLHDLWDLLGGAKRISNDLNHFSLEHGGVR